MSFLKGHQYKDFEAFLEENSNASIVEIDTVYTDGTNGPFIQTFEFRKFGFLFALYQESKANSTMNRGTGFCGVNEMKTNSDGVRHTFVFNCDAICFHQKGSIENNHTQLHYILPKGTDLRALSLQKQEDCIYRISLTL